MTLTYHWDDIEKMYVVTDAEGLPVVRFRTLHACECFVIEAADRAEAAS